MRIFSVDAGDPFLETLAGRILDGTLWPGGDAPDDPLALARVTIHLPTRRAVRALGEAFLAAAGGPTVLPRVEALGEADDEGPQSQSVVGPLEGRVAIAAMIRALAGTLQADMAADADGGMEGHRLFLPSTGPDLVRLADDLLALMDQVETQEASWEDLPTLVERTDLAAHWEITARFLDVAAEGWRNYLVETGRQSPASARRAQAEAAASAVAGARGPIIVAGSTGSIPATRRLIRAIAESPWGVVVLPAFDRGASPDDWAAVDGADDGPGHPQFGMKQLVDSLGIAPADVARLNPMKAARPVESPAREATLAAAFRPAPTTDKWVDERPTVDLDRALGGVALVEAKDEREEAAAIAIAMRGAIAAGEEVALVTPHRPLARRVSHALKRWNIGVDDSAGEPLAATPAGVFARLVAAVAMGGNAAEWLAFLKHPLCAAGADPLAVAKVEEAFRGPRIAPSAVLSVLARADDPAPALAVKVRESLGPLLALSSRKADVSVFAEAHAAAVSASLSESASSQDLTALAGALASLASCGGLEIAAADWPATFDALTSGIVVRGPLTSSAVAILGPLEARLQTFDHVVLAGLNEGTWPGPVDPGPWMSRGMMSAFGIDLPERKIGLAAHDVFVAAHAPKLTMTRAKRIAGEPTVASRWWQRLMAFAGPAAEPAVARGARLIALAEAFDARPAVPAAERPFPTPPLATRPTSFSVTEVGRLVRDPYAVYAKRILRLSKLDALEEDPNAADRGEIIHEVLSAFMEGGGATVADPAALFEEACAAALSKLAHAPDARALWGARLAHIAPFIIAEEAARAGQWRPILIEGKAEAAFDGITLRARVDRLDLHTDGTVDIIDYKTGKVPSNKEVLAQLLEPQLLLEALMLRQGAMGVPADAPVALTYVGVGKGRTPVEWRPVRYAKDPGATEDALARVEDEFRRLLAWYRAPENGYLSRARIKFEKELSGDYDHLARTAEWQG